MPIINLKLALAKIKEKEREKRHPQRHVIEPQRHIKQEIDMEIYKHAQTVMPMKDMERLRHITGLNTSNSIRKAIMFFLEQHKEIPK